MDPRAYTLHCLGEALEFDFGLEDTSNENLWLTLLHLSSIFCIFIVPLLLWSWKKNQSYKIDQHGRHVLKFQITMTLSLFAATFFLLMAYPAGLILLGEQTVNMMENTPAFIVATICMPLPLILIGFFCVYQGVVNAMRALSDKPVHYALSIPFVK